MKTGLRPQLAVRYNPLLVLRPAFARFAPSSSQIPRLAPASFPMWRACRLATIAGLLCLVNGCTLLRTSNHWEPFPHEVQRQQLVIHSESPLKKSDRIVRELDQQRDLINSALGLEATTTPIHVYLYADEQAYDYFLNLQYPEMAGHRAIFVGGQEQLTVYAYWSEQVAEDLRHEVSHGYLHAAVPNLPLWLDEGLAEYFEVGTGHHGFNETHAVMLAELEQTGAWQPQLERLEALTSAVDMTQQDYAESWAWVHYLLETPERTELLQGYLHDLQQPTATNSLSARIGRRLAAPSIALAEHVRSLR